MSVYLDHIFELAEPVKVPLMINYRSIKVGPTCSEIGNFYPEGGDDVVPGYGWSPHNTPPNEDEEQTIEPFLEFKSRDGKTTRDVVEPALSEAMQIRKKLESSGWRDQSKKGALKLKLDRQTISLELSRTESTSKKAFDIVITHKQKSEKFRPLKYLVEYGERLDRVLDSIVDLSRDVEDSNLRQHLRDLHRASSEIYVYGDKGPVGLRALGERF